MAVYAQYQRAASLGPGDTAAKVVIDEDRTFDIEAALTAGSGTITVNARDRALTSRLDAFWGLRRIGTTGSGPTDTFEENIRATLTDPQVGDVLTLDSSGTWVNLVGASGGLAGALDVSSAGYSADRTGNIDAGPIINAAITAAAATGKRVYLPAGTYKIATTIVPLSGVEIFGDGPGRTKLVVSGADLCCFKNISFSQGSPGTDMVFRDFEVDGSAVTTAGYNASNLKGFFIQHLLRSKFLNLYIHDTGASGLGVDHLQKGCLIDNCHVENAGRLNSGADPGGSGIGIGSIGTATDEEPVTISNCWAIGNKRYGIFFESQAGSTSTNAMGARIIGNYCSGGLVGISDAGNRRSIIANNTVRGASVAGITADGGTFSPGRPGYEGLIEGNLVYACSGAGIVLDYTDSGAPNGKMTVMGNEVAFNTLQGIAVRHDTVDATSLVIKDNVVHDNGRSGIRAYYTGATNTAGMKQGEVSGNVLYNNGTSATAGDRDGLRFDVPLTDVNVRFNRAFDRQGTKTQGYGLVISNATGPVGGEISDNDLRNNLTGTANITTLPTGGGRVVRNAGYNGAAPAAVSVTASPFTYNVPANVSTVYLYGGTVSSVTVAAVQVAAATGVALPVEPGDAVVVTYSSAPTMASRA